MQTSKGLLAYWRFVLFGFIISVGSLLGQTFFFSLFNTSIRESFNLSHGDFGWYYLIGTLSSAVLVAFVGSYIDKMRLQYWTLLIICGLFAACLIFTTAQSVPFLILGILMLRLFGQGMMSHTSSASMARYFAKYRGRALAIAGFGEPSYTILLPIPVSLLLTAYDWRFIWMAIATSLCLIVLLTIPLFLGRSTHFGELADVSEAAKTDEERAEVLKGLTRRQMLGTLRFKLLLPVILVPSFVNTGVIFHHQHLALEKDWGNIGGIFPVFATVAVLGSVLLGILVDKFTARKLIWLPLVPMTLAMLILSWDFDAWAAYLAFGLLGVSTAGMSTIAAAVWAEMFGIKHIGSIRALGMTLTVIGSALAPFLMGFLFDKGWSTELVCLVVASVSLFAMISGLLLSRYEAKAVWE